LLHKELTLQHLYIILLLSLSFSTVTDIDGNVYETVSISEQDWMAENLKVAHYNNGDAISTGQSNADWSNLSAGAYAIYNDDQANAEIYGNLYNWYAVVDEREICPSGWHIPDSLEWKKLINHLGGSNIAGGKLKEEGTVHWNDPNTGGTNESGFKGLPGGARISGGSYSYIGGQAYFWSSAEDNTNNAWRWNLTKSESKISSGALNKKNGFSVRCIKDSISSGVILVPNHYQSIQAALNAASEGDTILVSDGTYIENITWPATDAIKLLGSGIDDCIIDGNENGSVIVINGSLNTSTIISGFTIQNGLNAISGGGIVCYTNPTFKDLSIINNSASGQNELHGGGGMYIEASTPHLENVTIQNNTVTNYLSNGGGILCYYSSPTLINVTIKDNSTPMNGGGMYIYGGVSSSPLMQNVVITGNTAGYGGGIACYGSSPYLENVTITGNSVADNWGIGGGVYCDDDSSPTLVNCILWNDTSPEISFFEYNDPSTIIIAYSDVEGGQLGIVTNDNGTVSWGVGNIDADPLFVDSTNVHLQSGSPCIDAGTAFYELDGDTLINLSSDEYIGNAPDMGAFEYGINLDLYNPVLHTQSFSLHQNYPNPFNPTTTIRYDLQEISDLTLIVYDIKGREVEELYNGKQVAGYYSIIWDATAYSNGIYFVKMIAGEYVNTQKLMLIK